MLNARALRALGRLATQPTVNVQARRTLYPHYLRYMAVKVPAPYNISMTEKFIVYMLFLAGIMGPPTVIAYDVGKSRRAQGK